MSEPKKPLICWDTTVFLAWMNEEDGAPLADIDVVANEIHKKEVNLIVPVTIATEVLQSKMTSANRREFELFLKRPNIIVADTTLAIARKAGAIRDGGLAMKPKRSIKTPDATIIASAIIYRCDALHSLDNRGNGPLKLAGLPFIDNLRICRPISMTGQRGLQGLQ